MLQLFLKIPNSLPDAAEFFVYDAKGDMLQQTQARGVFFIRQIVFAFGYNIAL